MRSLSVFQYKNIRLSLRVPSQMVDRKDPLFQAFKKKIPRMLRRISHLKKLREFSFPRVLLEVDIHNEKFMQELNKMTRSIDKTTDVLSYPIQKGFCSRSFDCIPGAPIHLGNIVICPQYPSRICEYREKEESEKITLLFIHGLFHLLGYDHERSEKELELMTKLEVDFYNRCTS